MQKQNSLVLAEAKTCWFDASNLTRASVTKTKYCKHGWLIIFNM